jgi:spermidine synthase
VTRLRLIALLVAGTALLIIGYAASERRARVLFDAPSPYGRVRVVEQPSGLRQLRTGEAGVLQTALHPDRPLHLESAYTRVGVIGLALVGDRARILFVGLGGGAMPTFARHVLPNARIDVAEIDPLIVDVAQRFFCFRPDERMGVHTGDGRAFLESVPAGAYDLIVLDAFSAAEVPFALTTYEFLMTVQSRLAPGGVVVSNLWSAAPGYRSMVATYDTVFADVTLLRVPWRQQRILVAGGTAPMHDRASLSRAAAALQAREQFEFDLVELVQRGYDGAPAVAAPVLHDAAPVH